MSVREDIVSIKKQFDVFVDGVRALESSIDKDDEFFLKFKNVDDKIGKALREFSRSESHFKKVSPPRLGNSKYKDVALVNKNISYINQALDRLVIGQKHLESAIDDLLREEFVVENTHPRDIEDFVRSLGEVVKSYYDLILRIIDFGLRLENLNAVGDIKIR